jgi:hypothetical protein
MWGSRYIENKCYIYFLTKAFWTSIISTAWEYCCIHKWIVCGFVILVFLLSCHFQFCCAVLSAGALTVEPLMLYLDCQLSSIFHLLPCPGQIFEMTSSSLWTILVLFLSLLLRYGFFMGWCSSLLPKHYIKTCLLSLFCHSFPGLFV